jgi:hypothetical protein
LVEEGADIDGQVTQLSGQRRDDPLPKAASALTIRLQLLLYLFEVPRVAVARL